MKYFSMFSGIGGFEYGIQKCSLENLAPTANRKKTTETTRDSQRQCSQHHNEHTNRFTCVGFSEVDKYATQIYKKHFNHKEYGDVSKINWGSVEGFEILVGGFPCQAFSIAGNRKGFADTRGTLFFEIARCLKEKQPRLCVLENVKGLLSHDKGKTFGVILAALAEVGYDVQWQVLNSKNFGVPQNRERVFIIGHLRGTSRPEVFPIGEGNSQNEKVFPTSSTELAHSTGKNFMPKCCELLQEMGIKLRRLTPTECERLQGFPDGWTSEGVDGAISDTQRYKCLGNAVTTNVISAIFEKIRGGRNEDKRLS